MRVVAAPCFAFVASVVRGFRPRGRVTSLDAQRSNQESRPGKTAPAGFPALLEQRGPHPTRCATLRSNSGAESVLDASCARASPFCAARRFLRGSSSTANSQTRKPSATRHLHLPLVARRAAEGLEAFAKRTSRTDSVRLSERSVAKRVAHGASRPEQRRGPAAKRRAGGSGALSLPTFLCAQESRSPAGANSRHHTSRYGGAV